jgi:hypothetical protein
MANVNTNRLSPSELRRKLQSLPVEETPVPEPPMAEETPSPPLRVPARRGNETMVDFVLPSSDNDDDESIELNTITLEQLGAARLGVNKMTPLPASKLDFTSFRREEPVPEALPANHDEAAKLRAKNAELRKIIEEMKPVIEEANALEQEMQEKERALQLEIASRDKQIQELQEHLREIEEQISNAAPPIPKTPDELDEWADDLEKESAKLAQQRRQIEHDRKQLHEDEESLQLQMRQMEVQMARERAMMARQETELKRLSGEITHELELMQRGDGALREQMAKFQRRHQEVLRGAAPQPAAPQHAPAQPTPEPQPETSQGSALYRMFRRSK